MRIAFAANPALGHVLPLLPLALAARAAGHEVRFLGGSALAPTLEAFDLPHVVAGPPDLASVFERIDAARLDGPRLAVAVWSMGFAEIVARPLAHALLELSVAWSPDLVVHEDTEQGTWIAAERLGIPHLALQAAAWRGSMARLSAEPAARLRSELGVPPDPDLASWHRYGYLTTRPAALRDASDPMPPGTMEIRPTAVDDDGSTSAPWLATTPGGRPRVAVTLGTVMPERRGPQLATLVEALEPLDAEIVVALGPGLDPRSFLPRPVNIRLVSYVPMSRLLPASDLVVCHGGSGTILAALGAGRPLVLLPLAADQPANATACRAAGAARVLGRDERSPEAIREAVADALINPALARGAAAVAEEIEAMPEPGQVVPALERLAAG
jgi:UDP:flavonoid glycosyltransferase YjiC (YdhE family)